MQHLSMRMYVQLMYIRARLPHPRYHLIGACPWLLPTVTISMAFPCTESLLDTCSCLMCDARQSLAPLA